MKVLSICNLHFLLSEGFKGGFTEALRALADYHESVAGTDKQEIIPLDIDEKMNGVSPQKVWSIFLQEIRESDRRVVGSAGIAELDAVAMKMKSLDVNTGLPNE